MAFGDRLRENRLRHAMTQDRIAEVLTVTKGSVSAWETGRNRPLYDQIIAMCKLFRCRPDDLMGDDLPHLADGVRDAPEQYDTKRAQQSRERSLIAHFRAMSPKVQEALLDVLASRNNG